MRTHDPRIRNPRRYQLRYMGPSGAARRDAMWLVGCREIFTLYALEDRLDFVQNGSHKPTKCFDLPDMACLQQTEIEKRQMQRHHSHHSWCLCWCPMSGFSHLQWSTTTWNKNYQKRQRPQSRHTNRTKSLRSAAIIHVSTGHSPFELVDFFRLINFKMWPTGYLLETACIH